MTWDGRERRHFPIAHQQEIRDQLSEIRQHQVENEKMLKDCIRFISGNGHPEEGAVIRIDRLEQREKDRGVREKALWGATVTTLSKLVVDLFKR